MLRPWHYSLELDKSSVLSIHQQLTHHFRDMIESGHWLQGGALPSTRDIAQQLGINRKTVSRVYEELSAQGLIYTEPKRGTFVSRPATRRLSSQAVAPQGPMVECNNQYATITQSIQKAVLPHIRRAALHMHKLRRQDYDVAGLHSLKLMLANLLAHEKRFLVSPEQILCSHWLSLELGLMELLKQQPGQVLVDSSLPKQQRDTLQKHGIPLQVLPPLAMESPQAFAEQIEKYCINYPVSVLWCNTTETCPELQREQAHLLIAQKLTDYNLILIDDQRTQLVSGQSAIPLASHHPQRSLLLGSLYGPWCDMYNLHYLASSASIISNGPSHRAMHSHLDNQQMQALLLNMQAQSELIKRGDYKKLLTSIHRFLQSIPPA